MPRMERVCPVDIPQHIIQRGNNKQQCFNADKDRKAYLFWIKKYSNKYCVEIHAWVLMDNHVHILCTPKQPFAISKMMQAIGRMYVQYFNYNYHRTGTLWEGRFKSCLIETSQYLLEVYRYIELNPVRAKIVDGPNEYSWSSYSNNALGTNSNIITPHEEYLSLGKSEDLRLTNYQMFLSAEISPEKVSEIRISVNKGLALGSKQFIDEIEMITNQRVSFQTQGRPWRANKI